MKIVGDHLAKVAQQSADRMHIDLFGRSAYNRYYYSAFLHVRSALKTIDIKWATPKHQDVPVVLRGEVLNRLKWHIKFAEANRLISRIQGKQMSRAAAIAASELSNLLVLAREIRRVADYEPEQLVAKDGLVIKLGECTLSTAKGWPQRADTHAKTILKVYGQLGLI
jgi:hypothetical protein